MEKLQFNRCFCKKPSFILALILAAFFLKGVFLSAVFPIFEGQDEARHYNTIQFLSEPSNKSWNVSNLSKAQQRQQQNKDDLATYRFSDEIRNTATATDNSIIRSDIYNTMRFTDGFSGQNEAKIDSRQWDALNKIYPPDITGDNGENLYHHLGSLIEKAFADSSILVRFYLIRIFSVFLGTLTVLFAYFIIREIGFEPKAGLLMTAIISFQPKFSFYVTNVNYAPLLFLFFTAFTLGGILYLKNGLDWKNFTLMAVSAALGMITKGTAIVLVAMMMFMAAFFVYKKLSGRSKKAKYWLILLFLSAAVLVLIFFRNYLPLNNAGGVAGIFSSLGRFISETITLGKISQSSETYWAEALSWSNNWLVNNVIHIVWIVETFAVAGLGLLLFSKKPYPEYLPEKKYVVFLISMIVALQLGVRLADWKYFDKTGNPELGTPGRYFIPNLAAHIILVFTGLGSLFAYFKKEKYFDYSLVAGLILMFSLTIYLIFDVIILRFYL